MGILDSNDKNKDELLPEELSTTKQKQRADKAHHEKTATNNEMFVDICYQVFIEKMNLHYHIIQLVEYKQQMAMETEKEKHRAIAESEYAKSIENYNKSYKDQAATLATAQSSEDLARSLDELMKRITEAIAKINVQIKYLDTEIKRIKQDLTQIKKSLAQEIRNIFAGEIDSVNLSRQSLLVSLPEDLRHIAGAERFQGLINIDKSVYIRLAHQLAERLESGQIDFQNMRTQSKVEADKVIREEIAKLVQNSPFIPAQERESVINKMMGQHKVTQMSENMVVKLLHAISAQPAAAKFIDAGCQGERDLKVVEARKQDLLSKRAGLDSLEQTVKQVFQNQKTQTAVLPEQAVTDLEARLHKATATDSAATATEIIRPSIATAEKCIDELDDIKKESETDLAGKPTTPETVELRTEKMQEVSTKVESAEDALQSSLTDLLKMYTDKTNENSDEFEHHQGPSLK